MDLSAGLEKSAARVRESFMRRRPTKYVSQPAIWKSILVSQSIVRTRKIRRMKLELSVDLHGQVLAV